MILKNVITAICGLILPALLISCVNQTEQKVEAQNNSNAIKPRSEPNSNSVVEPKNEIKTTGKVSAKSDKPIIKPSNIVEELFAKKKANPKISAKELANSGNEMIKNKGYDFNFLTCEIQEANPQTAQAETYDSESHKAYNYPIEAVDGERTTFQIMNKFYDIPCGCGFDIPVFLISEREMVLRADEKSVKLKRPKEFDLDEVELVNSDLKTVVRKWYMPADNMPEGISKDGTKIYIDTGYDDNRLNELFLEVSENGSVRYVPRNDENIIGNGKELENFPKDPDNSYLGFLQFIAKDKKYIVKFSYPCT